MEKQERLAQAEQFPSYIRENQLQNRTFRPFLESW